MLGLSELLFVSAAFSEGTPQYLCLYPFCMEASLPKQRLILWISSPHALENGLRRVLAAEVWGYIEGRGGELPETPRVTEGGGQSVLIFTPLLGTKTSSNDVHFSSNTAAQKHAVFSGFSCP